MKDNLSFLENVHPTGNASILGIPLDLGKDATGTDRAPETLRREGIVKVLQETGYTVLDKGDVVCPHRKDAEIGNPKVKYLEAIVKVCEKAAELVAEDLKLGNKIIAIGGDNTVSIATLSAAAAVFKGDLGVIWIDAHADINTDETTLSGNVHGMPISAVLGMGHKKLAGIYSQKTKLKKENLLYIGLKDLDSAEIKIIRDNKIEAVTMMEIAAEGLSPALKKIKELSERVSKIWVCLDVDSMDKDCAPATPMATAGGLNYRESINLAKYIGRVCEVAGVDVSEFTPDRDIDNKTCLLVIELIASYLGGDYSWYTRYMKEEERKLAERKV